MTNFEKVKEEVRIEDIGADPFCDAIYRIRKELSCTDRTCEECRKWLEEEYVEPVELTEVERTILENVDKKYKYIARDENSELRIHELKPEKTEVKKYNESNSIKDFWINKSSAEPFKMFSHLFQFVQWEDTEPYEIAKLLGEE